MSSDVEATEAWLEDLSKKIEDNGDVITQYVAGEVFTSLTQDPRLAGGTGTPRDTRRAVNGWNIAPGETPDYSDGGRGMYGEPPDGRREALRKIPKGTMEATVANGVPYIEDLEHGTSKQAPAGFTRRAVHRALNFLLELDILNRRTLGGS